ncbi:MAG: YggS family pyridoxal phosphate-dependent enzyme [Sphaerochaeta sp.]|uniref:YggS family pyridoxal phosphate-dependent enzyme n=2 Tax=Sphaerochaeta sp. TaxID=1972642 RepID=UPI003D0EE845
MTDLYERWKTVLDSLAEAVEKAGRKPEEVQLMAVSKTHAYEQILSLHSFGQSLFGENRIQEVQQKFPIQRPKDLNIHLIGHLQSNKVRKAVQLFDAIDSVDSLDLAVKLDKALDRTLPILLELKTAPEETKSGFAQQDDLFRALDQIADLSHLSVQGLMTIGPLEGTETETRTAFAHLREVAEEAKLRFPSLCFSTLSMGMSNDFGWAIEEGSTMIRVGSAIFGKRGT